MAGLYRHIPVAQHPPKQAPTHQQLQLVSADFFDADVSYCLRVSSGVGARYGEVSAAGKRQPSLHGRTCGVLDMTGTHFAAMPGNDRQLMRIGWETRT